VQVVPIKPTLKASGSERLNLKCDDLLSNLAFNFNLRLNAMVSCGPPLPGVEVIVVGRCRLPLSNPR